MKTDKVNSPRNDASTCTFEIPASLASLAAADGEIEGFLNDIGHPAISSTTIYNIRLVIQELCTNIIRHAYGGEQGIIHLTLTLDHGLAQLLISSHDRGIHTFDHASWTPPDPEEPQVHGMGIWLMHQLMDEVCYSPSPGDNRWHLCKHIKDPS